MRKQLKTVLAITLSLLTVMSGMGSSFAASVADTFKDDYGVEWGEGTVNLTIVSQGEEISPGKYEDPTPIPGLSFDVYTVWTLEDKNGILTIDVKEGFQDVIGEDELAAMTDVAEYDDETGIAKPPTPSEEIRKMATGSLLDATKNLAPKLRSPETDAAGKATMNLPYGGYLFVPRETPKVGRTIYSAEPFLVTLPIMIKAEDDANPLGVFAAVVDATPKTQITGEREEGFEAKISKVDIGGDELPGAELTVSVLDGETGEWKIVEKWISEATPRVLEDLEPGIYNLHEDTAPVGYTLANDIYFIIDQNGDIYVGTGIEQLPGGYLDLGYVLVRTETLEDGTINSVVLTEENKAQFLLEKGGAIVMVDEPEITKTVFKTSAEDLGVDHDILTYTIKGTIPTGIVKSYEVQDVMEPVLEVAPDPNYVIRFFDGDYTSGSEITELVPSNIDLTQFITLVEKDGHQELKFCLDFSEDAEVKVPEELMDVIGGSLMLFTFDARIKADADLSEYLTGIPNSAEYNIDNFYKETVVPATYKPEVPETPGDDNPPPPPTEKEKTPPPSNQRRVRTGDETNIIIWVVLLALAAVVAGVLIKSRGNKK